MEDVLRSGPFTSVNGDRAYLNKFFLDYFKNFISNGVFMDPSTSLQVMANSGLTVTVKTGNAYINGLTHNGDFEKTLALDTADNLLPRIDKIVLRADMLARTATKQIKKGIPASNPTAPILTRNDDIWELGLATINVGKAATTITQANITDLRLNNEQCGMVHGLIEQVDTTTLFNQYQTWFNEMKLQYGDDWLSWFNGTKTQLQSEWDIWFANIQAQLDGDVAGNLLNKIEAIPKVISSATEPTGLKTGDIWLKELI